MESSTCGALWKYPRCICFVSGCAIVPHALDFRSTTPQRSAEILIHDVITKKREYGKFAILSDYHDRLNFSDDS